MHSAVWKLRKFTITHFWQKFREINVFSKEVTKELIWRKKFSGEREFRVDYFHTVMTMIWEWITKLSYLKKIRETNVKYWMYNE